MSPIQLLREIARLYRLLPAYHHSAPSLEILAAEAEIRALAERFKAAERGAAEAA